MKEFEVGKTYHARDYSYTKDGHRDYKHPQTMTITSRTAHYIHTEVKWGNNVSKRCFRVAKRMDAEQIDAYGRIITANAEI